MGGRFDVFHALDSEKQQRIINAALVEFATKGFKRASTNTIAVNARIGKGMLFYYFGSKEELFDFLCEYTIEFARTKYAARFTINSGDFLDRHLVLSEVKRQSMNDFPEVIGFFESFYHVENEQYFAKFRHEIAEIKALIYGKIYDGINYSLFRQDLAGKTVVKYLKWLLDGYERETTERFKSGEMNIADEASLAAEWSKFYSFIDDLRHLFYQEEKSHDSH